MHWLILPPTVMAFTALAMLLLDRYLPLVRLWEAPYHWSGIVLALVGLGIANWHARLFKKLGTNINTFGEPGTLTRQGLFRYTRNPMYLGFVIALAGLGVYLASVTPFLAVLCFTLLAHYWYIPFEERNLLHKFGQEYRDYQAEVRRWF